MEKEAISTKAAPAAIGTYSQAIRYGGLTFISGQIPLEPKTMEVVSDDPAIQIRQVFDNLNAIVSAADATLDQIVKLTIYLVKLELFAAVNLEMEKRFSAPYPARAVVEVSALPRGVMLEVEAILGN